MRTGTRYVRILDAQNAELEEAPSRLAAVGAALPRACAAASPELDLRHLRHLRLPLIPDLNSGSGLGLGLVHSLELG